jgi:hypothetical protein
MYEWPELCTSDTNYIHMRLLFRISEPVKSLKKVCMVGSTDDTVNKMTGPIHANNAFRFYNDQ